MQHFKCMESQYKNSRSRAGIRCTRLTIIPLAIRGPDSSWDSNWSCHSPEVGQGCSIALEVVTGVKIAKCADSFTEAIVIRVVEVDTAIAASNTVMETYMVNQMHTRLLQVYCYLEILKEFYEVIFSQSLKYRFEWYPLELIMLVLNTERWMSIYNIQTLKTRL